MGQLSPEIMSTNLNYFLIQILILWKWRLNGDYRIDFFNLNLVERIDITQIFTNKRSIDGTNLFIITV